MVQRTQKLIFPLLSNSSVSKTVSITVCIHRSFCDRFVLSCCSGNCYCDFLHGRIWSAQRETPGGRYVVSHLKLQSSLQLALMRSQSCGLVQLQRRVSEDSWSPGTREEKGILVQNQQLPGIGQHSHIFPWCLRLSLFSGLQYPLRLAVQQVLVAIQTFQFFPHVYIDMFLVYSFHFLYHSTSARTKITLF